jgi:predicted transcriptional regulator
MAVRRQREDDQRRHAGELESEVLAALWASGTPMTPAEVQAELRGDLAYNTVHTILKRLYDKDLVARDADGRRGAYRPVKNAAELTAEVMHRALNQGPDPIAALQQFITGLSPEEERALRDLLDETGPAADAGTPTGHRGEGHGHKRGKR